MVLHFWRSGIWNGPHRARIKTSVGLCSYEGSRSETFPCLLENSRDYLNVLPHGPLPSTKSALVSIWPLLPLSHLCCTSLCHLTALLWLHWASLGGYYSTYHILPWHPYQKSRWQYIERGPLLDFLLCVLICIPSVLSIPYFLRSLAFYSLQIR